MGRLWQLIAFFSFFCVWNYVWKECKGLRYHKSLIIVPIVILFFILIGFKHLSIPYITYLFIGIVGIPSIIYGVIYEPNILLIVATVYIPFNLLLPADFGGIQKALNGTNVVLVALFIGYMTGQKKLYDPGMKTYKLAVRMVILYIIFSLVAYVRGSLFHGVDYLLGFIFPLKRWLTPLIVMIIFLKMMRNREIIKIIYAVIMLMVIGNILYGVMEWVDLGFATYSGFKRRLGGMNMHPNFFGSFIAYYLGLIVGPFLAGFKKNSAKFLIFPILLGLRIIIPTNSRGAWVGIPPAFLTIAFVRSRLLFIVGGISLVVSLIVFPFFIPDTVRTRFEEGGKRAEKSVIDSKNTLDPTAYLSESKSVSLRTRGILLKGGLKLIKESPWFGVGWGVFPYVIGSYTENGLYGTAHNMFLKIVCEMGLVMLATLLSMFLIFFKDGLYIYRHEKDAMLRGMVLGYLASIPAIIVCNLTGNRFDAVDLITIFWIMSACILRLNDIIRTERFRESEAIS